MMREDKGSLGVSVGNVGAGRPIYLDHQATTPVDPRVAAVVMEVMTTRFGNANSVDHTYGEEAAGILDEAAEAVGSLVGTSSDHVHFTSGATEAIRLAVNVAARRADRPIRVIASGAEHRAVLDTINSLQRACAAEIRWLPVDAKGQISLGELKELLRPGADLLCLMAANNEVGTLYSVEAAADLAHEAGAQILVDATQAAGLVQLEADAWGIDHMVLSAHKLYGPKGVGALIGPNVRSPLLHEAAGHAGTPNVSGAAGFGAACRVALAESSANEIYLRGLRDRLESNLLAMIPNLVVNGDRARRLPHNLHVSVPGAPNDAVVARLRRTVAVSTGAACTSGAQEPSHVLRAMGLRPELQDTALRLSPGRFTTIDEIDRASAAIAEVVADVRAELREYA
jgi:cysteine desulfurase